MQGEAIVKRIILDANTQAEELLLQANNSAKQILDEAQDFAKIKQEEAESLAQEKAQQFFDRYETLSRIEGNKIILNKKQSILKDLKKQALDVLLQQSKEDMLSFVEKLIVNNASEKEKLLFNIKGITASDIEELSVVKKLNLKVEKNKNAKQVGIVLSSSTCDKNLLFEDLISYAFEQEQKEINRLLF